MPDTPRATRRTGYLECTNRSLLVQQKERDGRNLGITVSFLTAVGVSRHLRQNLIPLDTVVTGPFPQAVR